MSDPCRSLEEVRSHLRELLSLLDGTAEAEALSASLEECRRRMSALASDLADTEDLTSEERTELVRELEETLRLNAVALGRVEQEGQGLVERLLSTREHRRRLRFYQPPDPSGGSCDVAG